MKMSSKAIIFLCLTALVLTIASEVSARDLAETETKKVETNGVEESKHYGGGGGYGGGYGEGGGGGGYGGGYGGGGHGGGYGGGGYGGGHGGGYGGGYGGGHGGGHGGYCKYGCCGHYYGKCKCCLYAGQKAGDSVP